MNFRPVGNLLITGGLGFIGSAFIRYLLRSPSFEGKIINYDCMTYAARWGNLEGFHNHPRYQFIQGDINQQTLVETICEEREIDTIVHFAAETHVDRSIVSAEPFLQANVFGTVALLEVIRRNPHIHFHHISTDEVYGSLGESGSFQEDSPYRPNSPYAASKAASDHFVRAYANTYGLSTTMSHCSNNYGPGQNPEKLIPLSIAHCMAGKPIPIYGHGRNVRDWIYVDDHAEAVWSILKKGKKGQVYDIGGDTELANLDLLHKIIEIFAEHRKENPEQFHQLLRFVTDRPGHDFRYSLNSAKIKSELGWTPKISLDYGLKKTIQWYVNSL